MNKQVAFYSTGLAAHVTPHIVGGRRSTTAHHPAFSAPYGLPENEIIEAGPWHVDVASAGSQTQGQLIQRLIKMNLELSNFIVSLEPANWQDSERKTVARMCDLMQLEHSYCIPATVAHLEEVHGINPTPETGEVKGQYAEFSLLDWNGYELQ